MNKQSVVILIIVLSLALVGLMAIQGYWVRNAYRVRQTNFVRVVNEAAHDVIMDLEKMEMTRRMARTEASISENKTYVQSLDSINRILLDEMQSITTRRDLEVFYNKYFIARDLVKDMMISTQESPFEKKADFRIVDSLLTLEFDKRNMHTAFEFAVFNPFTQKMIMQKTGNYEEELKDPKISFHFELFPDDIMIHPDYLMLYFPEERRFLIRQIWPLLSTSIILILIIIASFGYTLIVLFRQRKLSELKSDFINNMTHEFKTPVSTISLACEALSDKDIQKSEDLYKTYIRIISEENRRLGIMAERILQSATIEKGSLVLNKEMVDIHNILSEVIKNIGIQVEIRDGQIIKDFKAKESIIEVDRMHMVNVVQNLLDNANKYTPVRPQIVVATRNENDNLVLSVRDNGIGISKVDQKKIFDKLYRVPEGNIHNFKGFGLGLNYVKIIVEKHGGSIRLESELKKGTTFEILLPLNHIRS